MILVVLYLKKNSNVIFLYSHDIDDEDHLMMMT